MIVAISAINAEFHSFLAESIIRQKQSTFGCFFISAKFFASIEACPSEINFE